MIWLKHLQSLTFVRRYFFTFFGPKKTNHFLVVTDQAYPLL